MMEYLSQPLEIGDALAGAVCLTILYYWVIVDPLKKRIIYLEEESQETLNEVYALSQRL
jgi:type II secretory pathway component PulM